ncbi:MAG: hypothetical protein LRY73_03620 [Bacillus sp. (in: Bacteria)]|nr:hypothetical protein [Bacillus sp. (in: firmicutes)]
MILQVIWAAYVEHSKCKRSWLKYVPSWTILLTGVMFLLISIIFGVGTEAIIARAGVMMIVTSLITIPLITVTLDEYILKRNAFLREK